MTIRDLGYRAYEGERLPPSHNTSVILAHGIRRAWGSWLIKLVVFFGWLPALLPMLFVGVRFWLSRQTGQQVDTVNNAQLVKSLCMWQMWICASIITCRAGAAAIAEDLTHKAFQFYFAKPLTVAQYYAGRVGAVAFFVFGMIAVPVVLLVLVLVGTAPPELRLESVGLLLPAILHAAVIAAVLSTASVGMSALSKSRALTMSAWLILLIVPHVIAGLVFLIGKWPWLYLASLPGLLGTIGDALFKIEADDTTLKWFHAAPVLIAIVVGAAAVARWRLQRAEVIA